MKNVFAIIQPSSVASDFVQIDKGQDDMILKFSIILQARNNETTIKIKDKRAYSTRVLLCTSKLD